MTISRIQFRRATATNWSSFNPTLLVGELGYETNTGKFKIGDGSTAWNSLSYATDAYVPLTAIGQSVASLVDGKIPNNQIPSIAITDTFVVSSQSAMLALSSAQIGDVAIRTDINKTFILSTSSPSTLSDWKELLSPLDAVSSVDGRTGTVTLNDLYVNVSSLASGIATFLSTPSSANLRSAVTDETGTGSLVFSDSPSLTTPSIGAATAASINGTSIPSSKNLVVTTDKLSVLAPTSSSELASVISDETGSTGGVLVFNASPTISTPVIDNIKIGYSTTATAAGTTTLTATSNYRQYFTGSTTQTVVLPVSSTMTLGQAFEIHNNSTGTVTVNTSAGAGNTVATVEGGKSVLITAILTSGTTTASWSAKFIGASTNTGTGALVFGTAPTVTNASLVTPSVGSAGFTLAGSSTGNTTIITSSTGGGTVTVPAGTQTLATQGGQETFTNKTITQPTIDNIKMGWSTTATAGGTTTLTATSNYRQFFTGTLNQIIVLPVSTTMTVGQAFEIHNNGTGTLTVNSSGGNLVATIEGGKSYLITAILNTGTTAASWDADITGATTGTGTGSLVFSTSPTITAASIDSINNTSIPSNATLVSSAGPTVLGTTQSFTTTGTSNNVSLAATTTLFRYSGSAAATITGFSDAGATPASGRTITIQNASAFSLTLSNLTGSTSAYQMTLPSFVDLVLGPNDGAVLTYDGTSGYWRVSAEGHGVPRLYMTSDMSLTSQTVLQTVSQLSPTVQASAVVTLDYFLPVVVGATAQFKVGWSIPAGATLTWATALATAGSVVLTGTTITTASSTAVQFLQIRAYYVGGVNAGAINFQFAQVTSSTTPTVIKRGAWVTYVDA